MSRRGTEKCGRTVMSVAILLLSWRTLPDPAQGLIAGADDLSPAHPVVLLNLHMVTRQMGWGMSLDAILHTTDSGHHWKVSRRIGNGNSPYLGAAGLVALGDGHVLAVGSTRVFSTTDGGRQWRISRRLQGSVVPGRGITFGSNSISFVGPDDGSIFTTGGAAAGSAVYSVYRTRNAGATWSRFAYNTLMPGRQSRGRLPRCDCIGGVSFRDKAVGWLTGSPFAIETELILERTLDGGANWSPQPLSRPRGFQQFNRLA